MLRNGYTVTLTAPLIQLLNEVLSLNAQEFGQVGLASLIKLLLNEVLSLNAQELAIPPSCSMLMVDPQ